MKNFITLFSFGRIDSKIFFKIIFVLFFIEIQSFAIVENKKSIRLASYNVQIFPDYLDLINPPNHKNIRVHEIPVLLGSSYDIIFFNELFDVYQRKKMVNSLIKNYPFYSDVANQDLNFLSSGIAAFSKWPIEKKADVKYKSCEKEECLASKGALYIKINKLGEFYHFFATHLQSEKTENSYQTRENQLETLRDFILEQNIPDNEPIILAGDFNIDAYDNQLKFFKNHSTPISEIDYTLQYLNVRSSPHVGYKYSYDYYTNKMTALNKSNLGMRLALDHIWIMNNRAIVTNSLEWYQDLKSAHPDLANAPDTSDHFPVMSEIAFAN